MNGYKAVKVAELRAKLATIPAKLVLSVVIVFALGWDTDLEATASFLAAHPFDSLRNFVILYGLLSYVYFFIRMFNSYIVGILVAAGGLFAIYSVKDRMDEEQFRVLMLIMLFGGPVLDVVRMLRYSGLKKEVIEESENLKEKIDDIYENVHGYDEGYDRGYDDGYQRASYDGIPERRRMGIGKKSRHRGRYDDRLEDRYYDDEEEYDDEYEEEYYDDDEEYDEYDEEDDESYGSSQRGGYGNREFGFFDGCRTPEAIKRRYRELCKVYHPDSGNGSEALFEAVNEEYRRLMDE